MIKRIVALATLAASLSFAGGGFVRSTAPVELPSHSSRKLWWSSVAALAAVSVLDARSSWGKRELNPLLQGPAGRFSARSVEIKTSLVGAGVVFQWLALRHKHHSSLEKPLSMVNFAAAGLTAGAAVHNMR